MLPTFHFENIYFSDVSPTNTSLVLLHQVAGEPSHMVYLVDGVPTSAPFPVAPFPAQHFLPLQDQIFPTVTRVWEFAKKVSAYQLHVAKHANQLIQVCMDEMRIRDVAVSNMSEVLSDLHAKLYNVPLMHRIAQARMVAENFQLACAVWHAQRPIEELSVLNALPNNAFLHILDRIGDANVSRLASSNKSMQGKTALLIKRRREKRLQHLFTYNNLSGDQYYFDHAPLLNGRAGFTVITKHTMWVPIQGTTEYEQQQGEDDRTVVDFVRKQIMSSLSGPSIPPSPLQESFRTMSLDRLRYTYQLLIGLSDRKMHKPTDQAALAIRDLYSQMDSQSSEVMKAKIRKGILTAEASAGPERTAHARMFAHSHKNIHKMLQHFTNWIKLMTDNPDFVNPQEKPYPPVP